MSLIHSLPSGALDFIGDVHGEYDALCSLLTCLGYPLTGEPHPDGRHLVFVGDLFDRGPDSPSVFKLVERLHSSKVAYIVLGNHELSLLTNKAKEGSGWFFSTRADTDTRYIPFEIASPSAITDILQFLKNLPIVLEREDVRVVHAAWHNETIETLRTEIDGTIGIYERKEREVNSAIKQSGLKAKYNDEQNKWGTALENQSVIPPLLESTMEYMLQHQMGNPIRIATAGMEQRASKPFFGGGKWRFVERTPWWNAYDEQPAVICGHYWRRKREELGDSTEEPDIFGNAPYNAWLGGKKNVFCIDYSVGARYKERAKGLPVGTHTQLAALRWPERTLVFEDGEIRETIGFRADNK